MKNANLVNDIRTFLMPFQKSSIELDFLYNRFYPHSEYSIQEAINFLSKEKIIFVNWRKEYLYIK